MNQEQKIYALMACAEDHQKIIDESIQEFKTANQQELVQLAAKQKQLHDEHRIVMKDLRRLAEKASENNFQRLGWMWFIQTLLASLLVVSLSVGGVIWFVNHKSDEIIKMNYTVEKLSKKGGEAEIHSCRRDNGKVYPCVRVMTKWGGYGNNRDLYIIDPK
jgi:hypothetical protein